MMKRRSQLLTASFLVCDLFMTFLAWCGAYYVRFDAGFIPITKTPPDPALLWANLPLVLLLAAFSFHATGQYAIHRLRRLREEVIGVVKGVTLLALLVLASTFFRHDPYESRRRDGPVLGRGRRSGADGSPPGLGRRPHAAQPRLQPNLFAHRRRRPHRSQDRPRLAQGQLDGHQERRLRRGSPRPDVRRSRRGRRHRRPAAAHLDVFRQQCLHRPAAQSLRRRPPRLRRAVAVAGRGAAGGRRAQPGRPVAVHDEPRRPARRRLCAKVRISV